MKDKESKRSPTMKRTMLLAAVLAATTIFATADKASAMRDPGAGGATMYNYSGHAPTPPRIGQNGLNEQYADGMNLYEYVGSNPANGLDPLGLWKVERKGGLRAETTAEADDTIATLAKKIQLDEAEFGSWLKTKGSVLTQDGKQVNLDDLTVGSRICPGQKFTVPNMILVAYGEKKWYDHGGTVTQLLQDGLRSMSSSMRSDGYNVLELEEPPTELLQSGLKMTDLCGAAYAGHGDKDGITPRNNEKIALYPRKYVHHRLAFLWLLACSSLVADSQQGYFDPDTTLGRQDVSRWEVNVSKYGKVIGFDADVSVLEFKSFPGLPGGIYMQNGLTTHIKNVQGGAKIMMTMDPRIKETPKPQPQPVRLLLPLAM